MSKIVCHLLLGAVLWPVAANAQTIPYVTQIYKFTGKTDGSNPIGGVIGDAAGALYGETSTGGTTACSATQDPYNPGCGTVYTFSAAGALKVLATFTGPNGAHGNTTLALAGSKLYGVTSQGGASNDGVVFTVNTDGSKFTVLHQFSGTDGSMPNTIVVGAGGMIYGTTLEGGVTNYGTLYSLTPAGTYTVLYTFSLPRNGFPVSLLIAQNGTLVGSTKYGNTSKNNPFGYGTVFSYIPASATFSTLYSLPFSGAQGSTPYVGSIGPGPTIYGADASEAFSLSQEAGFVPLGDFNFYTVGNGIASGPLYTPSGELYGVVEGNVVGASALYTLKNGQVVDVAYTIGFGDYPPALPFAKPYLSAGGSLSGTDSIGGLCTDCGSIWQYTP